MKVREKNTVIKERKGKGNSRENERKERKT